MNSIFGRGGHRGSACAVCGSHTTSGAPDGSGKRRMLHAQGTRPMRHLEACCWRHQQYYDQQPRELHLSLYFTNFFFSLSQKFA